MRVLIAEDSMAVAERLEAMESELDRGIDLVGRAADVPGAIAAVHSLRPDVVILDIRMPGGSGIDVLECIKRDRSQTVVMMFTNYPEPGCRQRCSVAGAEYFFDKSHDEDVSAVLSDLLRA